MGQGRHIFILASPLDVWKYLFWLCQQWIHHPVSMKVHSWILRLMWEGLSPKAKSICLLVLKYFCGIFAHVCNFALAKSSISITNQSWAEDYKNASDPDNYALRTYDTWSIHPETTSTGWCATSAMELVHNTLTGLVTCTQIGKHLCLPPYLVERVSDQLVMSAQVKSGEGWWLAQILAI